MLERKPLVVIIYTLAAVVACLFSTILYLVNDYNKRLDAKDVKIEALSKEVNSGYRELKDAYKSLSDFLSPERYYEKKFSVNRDNDSASHNGGQR